MTLQRCHLLGLDESHKSRISYASEIWWKFCNNFNEKALAWSEQTKDTELIVRFFEQVTKHSTAVAVDENQAFFNLSKEKVGDLTVCDETIYILRKLGAVVKQPWKELKGTTWLQLWRKLMTLSLTLGKPRPFLNKLI